VPFTGGRENNDRPFTGEKIMTVFKVMSIFFMIVFSTKKMDPT
jgi:hypothetical protein